MHELLTNVNDVKKCISIFCFLNDFYIFFRVYKVKYSISIMIRNIRHIQIKKIAFDQKSNKSGVRGERNASPFSELRAETRTGNKSNQGTSFSYLLCHLEG